MTNDEMFRELHNLAPGIHANILRDGGGKPLNSWDELEDWQKQAFLNEIIIHGKPLTKLDTVYTNESRQIIKAMLTKVIITKVNTNCALGGHNKALLTLWEFITKN